MGEILACRVCLSTNVKLYDMYSYSLHSAYENLSGLEMKPLDGLPQHACSFCSVFLMKTLSFKETCCKSQDLLKFALIQNEAITTEYISSLDFDPPFKYEMQNTFILDKIPNENEIKEEEEREIDFEDVKIEFKVSSSDEEPLSNKVRKKKHKKNIEKEVKKEKDEATDDDFVFEDKNFDDAVSESDVQDNIDTMDSQEVDVIILSKEKQIEEIQSRKNSLNYLNSFYKCDKCFKGFITDATYKNHMIRHDPSSGPHVCEICQTRWPHSRSLRAHIATSHERKFVCKLCSYVSTSRHRAKEHSKWHSGHLFVCKICGASFSKSTSHLTHVRLHHPSKHCCDVCGESFIGQMGLNMHKKKAHRRIENQPSKAESRCSHCNIQFRTSNALKRHLNNIENEPCDPNMRSCVQCGESFSTEELLKEHLKMHSKDNPVKCEECDRTFAHERSYATHYQRVHLGVRLKCARGGSRQTSVVCEICGKKCISKATLIYHQRTHTGEKPYQCTECPKKFSVYQRLQIHLRTHTGERPYQCSHCPKAFKHKAALNRHDRVHTGAKPYSCSHCGKCFSQSNSMKLHVRTVHLKLPAPYRARPNLLRIDD